MDYRINFYEPMKDENVKNWIKKRMAFHRSMINDKTMSPQARELAVYLLRELEFVRSEMKYN